MNHDLARPYYGVTKRPGDEETVVESSVNVTLRGVDDEALPLPLSEQSIPSCSPHHSNSLMRNVYYTKYPSITPRYMPLHPS